MNATALIPSLDPTLASVGIFGAEFVKADGTIRTGSFRIRPPQEDGPGMAYSPTSRGNLIVWDMNKQGYRSIKVERLRSITAGGRRYTFTVENV